MDECIICLGCGKEEGKGCVCSVPNFVEKRKCDGCSNIMGILLDDLWCPPAKLYCSECVSKVKVK